MYCAVLALGLSVLGLLCLIGGAIGELDGGTVVGLMMLTPAVLMWTALFRLATRPPRGAVLLIASSAAVGVLVLFAGLFAIGAAAAFGAVAVTPYLIAAAGLAFLGGAALVLAQVFGRSRNAGAPTN